jgi:hypothetical protein
MLNGFKSLMPVVAFAAALTLAPAANAQFQSSSGAYFHSAGAAYMNTLLWSSMSRSPAMSKAMSESEARANGQNGPHGNAGPAASSSTAALAASDFKPVPEERGKVIDLLVADQPAGPARDRLRARITALSAAVENGAGHKYNLAETTYLLIGVSLQTATGRPIETARAQGLIRAVAAAYAADSGFHRLDDRRRSQMYYLYTSLIALTGGLSVSKDPSEVQVARTLARNTLREMGIRP